jgi:hypothetical protein
MNLRPIKTGADYQTALINALNGAHVNSYSSADTLTGRKCRLEPAAL